MKGIPALLMRTLVVLIGVGALAFLILEPLSEGRNTHATLSEVYLHDPFLALLYAASILFFLALYRVFRLTGRTADAEARASDLRVIRNCALSLVAVLA